MLKLLGFLKPFVKEVLLIVALTLVQALCDLSLPTYMSDIINVGIGQDKGIGYILRQGGLMLSVAFLSMFAVVVVCFTAARMGARCSMGLRKGVFAKVLGFSGHEFGKFSTASLITRSTNDIQQIQMLVSMMLRMIIYAPILGIGGVFKVLSVSTRMTWIIALAVALVVGLVAVLFTVVMPKFKLVQTLVDRLNLVTRESLDGMLVIRAFGNQKHDEEKFDVANSDLTNLNLFVNRVMSLMMPVMMLIMNLTAVAIIWYGAKNIDEGFLQVGDVMAFIQYSMQIIMSFLMISMISIFLPRALVSANRIDEVLKTEISIVDPAKAEKTSPMGTIEFKNVSFKYPGADEYILENISFKAKKGSTTAIIGSTGSGKTTLINLIPRFYDVSDGEILVDGVDVKKQSLHSLRDKIGYVPQKGLLFFGSIKSNLLFGKNFEENQSEERMLKASKIAQANFIDTLPEKYENQIAQGGSNVSGGQKQRLAIARALTKKSEILIFDDSFSALDFKTDANLRAALKKEVEATILVVAQRINTIRNADQILVLDEGKLVGIGTHTELLAQCEVYRQIASSQLSEKEMRGVANA